MYEFKENQWATVVFSLVFLFFTICDRSDGDDKMPVHHRPNVAHSFGKLGHSLRSAGLHVWCWTVNDVDRMQTLLDWGVESITTDRPELLTDVLKKQIERSQ